MRQTFRNLPFKARLALLGGATLLIGTTLAFSRLADDDSAKAPDAMLNIASSQQEMNKKPAARKTLETLVARYPGSEAADKAKRRLISKK